MAEQATLEAQGHLAVAGAHDHRRHQIGHDVIVVAGVEGDALLGMGGGNTEADVQRAVAVERRHLDRHDIVDRGEAGPEFARQLDPAHRRLQVEADQRHFLGDRGAMLDQLVLARTLQRRQRQQHGVITERARRSRFLDRLRRLADRARDHDQRPVGPVARRTDGEFEDRPIEPDLADGELRGMDAHRESAGTGVEVVAAQGALRRPVEVPVGVERQRVRGDDGALPQQGQDRRRKIAPVEGLVGAHACILSQFRAREGKDM